MSKRKALGKGLRSLIPEAPAPAPQPAPPPAPAAEPSRSGLKDIDLDRIEPNPRQPRSLFTEQGLKDLSDSLREQGVLQPLVLRPKPGGQYEIVAGERRWRAAQMAGLLKVPAVIRHISDTQLLEYALVENIQREELTAIETAQALLTLVDDLGLTQQEVADKVGKPRSTVANYLRLLNLEPQVQGWIEEGKLSAGHAKALVSVTQPERQCQLAAIMVDRGLSVRQAEALVQRDRQGGADGSAESKDADIDPNIAAAEESLQRQVGTKVRIVQKGERGRIELHFFSHEEMERVYQRLMGRG